MEEYEEYSFINNFNNILSVEQEIYYLVSKVQNIESKCKINKKIILNLVNNIPQETTQEAPQELTVSILTTNTFLFEYDTDIIQLNNKYQEENKYENNEENEESIDEEDDNKYLFLHKIYKKLARYLHPDKQRTHKNTHFLDVKYAFEQKNLSKLIYLSVINKINLDILESEYEILKKEINNLDNYINKLKNSVFHSWQTLSEEQKEDIILKYKNINNLI
tara:strand:- start:254 stop:913 length:660 start_codon:yes stop_codon:yes gene_type:complete